MRHGQRVAHKRAAFVGTVMAKTAVRVATSGHNPTGCFQGLLKHFGVTRDTVVLD